MNINATLFAQFIVFFVLAWVVMRFIWPPLIQALDERRAKIAEGLSAAEDSIAEKASTDATIKELLKGAKLEAAEIVSMAQQRAEDTVEQSRGEAQVVANKQIEAAHEKINLETNKAKEALRNEVAALSLEGARRIIGKEIDQETHEKLLKELAAQL